MHQTKEDILLGPKTFSVTPTFILIIYVHACVNIYIVKMYLNTACYQNIISINKTYDGKYSNNVLKFHFNIKQIKFIVHIIIIHIILSRRLYVLFKRFTNIIHKQNN